MDGKGIETELATQRYESRSLFPNESSDRWSRYESLFSDETRVAVLPIVASDVQNWRRFQSRETCDDSKGSFISTIEQSNRRQYLIILKHLKPCFATLPTVIVDAVIHLIPSVKTTFTFFFFYYEALVARSLLRGTCEIISNDEVSLVNPMFDVFQVHATWIPTLSRISLRKWPSTLLITWKISGTGEFFPIFFFSKFSLSRFLRFL